VLFVTLYQRLPTNETLPLCCSAKCCQCCMDVDCWRF
jgi:hypothetical protein